MSSSVDVKDYKKKTQYICIRCGFAMRELSVCHLKCFKCGSDTIVLIKETFSYFNVFYNYAYNY